MEVEQTKRNHSSELPSESMKECKRKNAQLQTFSSDAKYNRTEKFEPSNLL
jgi:hypothetical protein